MATSATTPSTIHRTSTVVPSSPLGRSRRPAALFPRASLPAGPQTVQVVDNPRDPVAELPKRPEQGDELGRLSPLRVHEQPRPAGLERERPVGPEEPVHHPLVDEVVRELAVLALD